MVAIDNQQGAIHVLRNADGGGWCHGVVSDFHGVVSDFHGVVSDFHGVVSDFPEKSVTNV